MATIKIEVKGNIARNLTPDEKLVCRNEGDFVEFSFDSSWENYDVKTALFIFNGELVAKPFNGDTCKIPMLKETEILFVGVSSSDGELKTTTPATVQCLLSASDIAGEEIEEPSQSVYDEIIALINQYMGGGTSTIIPKFRIEDGKLYVSYNEWETKEELGQVKGEDGVAPTIEIRHDYWYINGVDTGVKALGTDGKDGKDGKDGVTPTIEIIDGYWHINGENTGVKAEVNGAEIVVDSELSRESTNPVQNKVVAEAFNEVDKKIGDIETALDSIIELQNSLIGGGL